MQRLRSAVVSIALLAIVAPGAEAAYPGLNGPLVFQSSRDGDNEIYILNADGTGVTKLTDNAAGDTDPVWSPDGQRIAFQSNRDGDSDVWVMEANGSNPVALTDDPAFDGQPTWSLDGTRLAFTSRRDGDDEIFSMDDDGSNETQLTSNTATDEDPAWGRNSPCAPPCPPPPELIAFTTDRDGNEEIYLMGEDGTGLSNFTSHPADDREAAWRPDLSNLAFSTNRNSPPGDPDFDIWYAGGPVADSPVDEVAPAWSPDGDRIAWEQVNGVNREIYVDPPAGGSAVNVTNAATNERAPDWRPEPITASSLYARPRGATPMRVSLTPAFAPCSAPNRTHGPPLAFGSCAPPAELSSNVTVGTPDHLGGAANSTMVVRLDVRPGVPGPPEDSDISITVSFTDIRCRAAIPTCGPANAAGGADYTGELVVELPLQITDRWNASVPGGGPDSATSTERPFAVPLSCTSTASTSTGATCSASTSVGAIAPLAVRDSRRTMWQLGQVLARDGGADGEADTTGDNSLFAVQGVFVP